MSGSCSFLPSNMYHHPSLMFHLLPCVHHRASHSPSMLLHSCIHHPPSHAFRPNPTPLRLKDRKVLIKRTDIIENLGCASIIASDKTVRGRSVPSLCLYPCLGTRSDFLLVQGMLQRFKEVANPFVLREGVGMVWLQGLIGTRCCVPNRLPMKVPYPTVMCPQCCTVLYLHTAMP